MFNPKELNRAYYDIVESIKTKPFTVLYGGRNAAKSHSAMQWLAKTLWNEADSNAVWYRKEQSVLKSKAYEPMKNIIEKKGLVSYMNFTFHNLAKEIKFPKGNTLKYDFCDDGGKSKGYSNIRYVIIDEIDQLTINDFMGIVTSFRADDRIRFIIMFNPVSDKHWLKKVFFEENAKDIDVSFRDLSNRFHYTIEDNKFATEMDYLMLEALKGVDINQYGVQRLGKWGTVNVDNPFLDRFVFNTHVKKDVPYFKDYPIYLGLDFGKYDSCVVAQHFEDYEIGSDGALYSYFSPNKPANTRLKDYRSRDLRAIIQDVVAEFGSDNDYIVYGDTSGGSDEFSKFAEIRNYLEDCGVNGYTGGGIRFPYRIKLRHKGNRAISNWCFYSYGDNYVIDAKCEILINDLQQVRVDEFGNIDKNDCVRHNIGHCFVKDTLVTNEHGAEFISNIKEGEFVKTRYGYNKVLSSGITRKDADVYKFILSTDSDKYTYKCTKDHKFYTENKGFVEIDLLEIGDLLLNETGIEELKSITKSFHGIEDVYCLTVEENHEFYANTLLVSNCLDSSRYLDVLTDGGNFIKNNGYYAKDILGKDTALIN